MPRLIFYPYKMGSASGRTLSRSLDATRVYPDRRYRPRRGDLIVNWGNSTTPNWDALREDVGVKMLNSPISVKKASNKLLTLRVLEDAEISIPRFTTDRETAQEYNGVYARHELSGNSGSGIEYIAQVGENMAEEVQNYIDRLREIVTVSSIVASDLLVQVPTGTPELPLAPLYTERIDTKSEYRVHVFEGKVISYAKKRRREDWEGDETNREAIRSYDNGWVFCRENLRRLERIEQIAVDAVEALGLDFGGVDIVKDQDNKEFVLEVNTACGIEGETLEAYKLAIKEIYG